MDPTQEIRFDGWTLRRQSGELLRNGVRIRLQSQPLQVLEELLARPGEMVTREQLIARLWPKGVVDFDTALNSTVRRLRVALGDHAETPLYIETIPRRGYRFIGRVEGSVVVAPTPTEPAVAAAVPVRGRRRWWLAASALLFIAASIAAVVSSRTGGGAVAPHPAADSTHAQAQERFLRAQHFFQRRTPGDIERARKYFEEAVEVDPGFARAWAGLAGAYWLEMLEGGRTREQGLSMMRDAAEKALALDPGLAEAHLRLAAYRWSVGDLPERDEHLRKALALEPDNPLVLGTLAGNAAQEGRFDAAIELQRRAVEAEPLSALNRHNLGSILFLAGRRDEAKAEMLKLQELHPTPDYVNELLALVLILEGRPDEVLQLVSGWPDDATRQYCLALAYHGLGRGADSDAALRSLTAASSAEDRFRVAEVHAFRGEIDEAFAWLQRASEESRTPAGPNSSRRRLWMMPQSPLLQSLHSDPRWESWLASVRRERPSSVLSSAE